MENYTRYLVEDDEKNRMWGVYEEATEQFIKLFYFEDECEDYQNFLNNGGGFNGYTPEFILNDVETKKDLDIEMENFLRENFE